MEGSMQDFLDSLNEEVQLTDKQVFTEIWTNPRMVFKYINENRYEKYMTALLFLAGVSSSINRATLKNMGDKSELLSIIGLSIVLGGLFGWISYYIYSAMLSWTGKWLDGEGNTKSILRVLSHAMLPSIISILFLIPQIGVYGNEIFKSNGDISSAGIIPNILVYSCMAVDAVLGLWTMVLCVLAISEVQKLSIGKSILNLLLPILIIVVPLLLIVLIAQL
jgi:hypothetical protein